MRRGQRLVRRFHLPQLEAQAFRIREQQAAIVALATDASLPEIEGCVRSNPQHDAMDHALARATRARARIFKERQIQAGAALVVAEEQVVDRGIVLVDSLLDEAQAEPARIEVNVGLRVGGD